MASDSYALTLWTFLQSEEYEYFAQIVREAERLDEAELTARGMIEGTKEINQRRRKLFAKTRAPITIETREEMSRRADEMWDYHEAQMKRRLPS